MPRKKREWYEGACYHVMGRGNRHCAIYKDKEDYVTFLNLVASVKARYPFTLHAYCLMTNHFHLLITTSNDPIWKIMQPIMNHYARTFNQKNGLDGHLFDSRYVSCLIEDDIYFLEPREYLFPKRNRLIAALSDVLYVVDAGRNSGTSTTVKSAVKYGRNVL